MDLLVTETEIRDRMSLPDHADITSAILSALGAAQIQIESDLRTTFTKQENLVDLFHVNVNDYWTSLPHDLATLRLRAGFIDKTSISVRSFNTLLEAMTSTVVGSVVDPMYYRISDEDAIRGLLMVNTRYYDLQYLKVTYDAGFEDADDENIPEWLREAITAKATGIINTQATGTQTVEALQLLHEQQIQLSRLIEPYARKSMPFSYRPIL